MLLSHEEAVKILDTSEDFSQLALAAACLAEDPDTKPEELLRALDYPGYIAELASIALHNMTGTPRTPTKGIVTSRRFWTQRLQPKIGRLFRNCPQEDQVSLVELLARSAALEDDMASKADPSAAPDPHADR